MQGSLLHRRRAREETTPYEKMQLAPMRFVPRMTRMSGAMASRSYSSSRELSYSSSTAVTLARTRRTPHCSLRCPPSKLHCRQRCPLRCSLQPQGRPLVNLVKSHRWSLLTLCPKPPWPPRHRFLASQCRRHKVRRPLRCSRHCPKQRCQPLLVKPQHCQEQRCQPLLWFRSLQRHRFLEQQCRRHKRRWPLVRRWPLSESQRVQRRSYVDLLS